MYLTFDTETTGLPKNYSAPISETDNWPRMVQIAWQINDKSGNLISSESHIIKPKGYTIPFNAEKIHGISTQKAIDKGKEIKYVLEKFNNELKKNKYIIGHNINFDVNILGSEFYRSKIKTSLLEKESIDTGLISKEFCQLEGGLGGKLKMPKLIELYNILFESDFSDAHDARADVNATAKCFFELMKRKVFETEESKLTDIKYEGVEIKESNFKKNNDDLNNEIENKKEINIVEPFIHLHNHSHYSILQATSSVTDIIDKSIKYNMPAVALTDLGNMFGAFKFVQEANKKGIKPIVGCEFFISEDRKKTKFTRDNPDKRHNQILLAKNKDGYNNLSKLSSLGYLEGLYGLYPRIDKELIKEYKNNLIALSGGLQSSIPNLILNYGEDKAEEELKWWLDVFNDDFYLELLRHNLEEENHVNKVLLNFSKKYNVKVIAANEVYYTNKEDSDAHDILLCIKQGEFKSTEIGKGSRKRFGFPNNEYYFKTQEEMKNLFQDLPESIVNISEIIDKVETYDLKRKVVLPNYEIPKKYFDPNNQEVGENAFLKKLTLDGAKKKYKKIDSNLKERINFELEAIKNIGYPGYFLIVQDITNKAKEIGVSVGPGRGSAAGSVVAYCIGITNIDPIKYNLLFERFLNPDRISLPDIDIDFDDIGRDKIIDYVVNKYGYDKVAQIITYGTMAAKSSIRDAGRVLELSLSETDKLAKLVPDRPSINLIDAFKEVSDLSDIRKKNNLESEVLNQAEVIEGSLRNVGTHACGIIITPEKLTKYIPVSKSKDSELLITQFDNSVIESAGMLKMDFLGLKTLSILNTAVKNVKNNHEIEIDLENLPLDDKKTYEMYQKGYTNATFQFESLGMQKHLKALKPDRFEDLIAMNALYRPGPMEYIPNYIARKHGKEKIEYDLPEMEEFLGETFGITVYQEQVMLISQKIANFSKGEADQLRKAMGKKDAKLLKKLKPKFFKGGTENNIDQNKLEKIWQDWQSFAEYAFNKSHSTCYSSIAYKTTYMKANYISEYMAAVLSHNQNNIDKISYFMDECRKAKIKVLGPDINQSGKDFICNKSGEILFGIGAVKGTGGSAVQSILEERNTNGPFKDIFDFAIRTNSRTVNKKTYEALSQAGAFDCFEEIHRKQYIHSNDGEFSLIERAIQYAGKVQKEKETKQTSLFGDKNGIDIPIPEIIEIEPYSKIEKQKIEKEILGLYVSGHPLDKYKLELENFCNSNLKLLKDNEIINKDNIKIGGIISNVEHRISKNGKPYGIIKLEDYEDNYQFYFFGDDYIKWKNYFENEFMIIISGKLQPRWNDPNQNEVKIFDIKLLSELRKKMIKELNITINSNDINENFIKEINNVFVDDSKGNCKLTFTINSENNGQNFSLNMLSRNKKIDVSNDLISRLENLPYLEYKIIK